MESYLRSKTQSEPDVVKLNSKYPDEYSSFKVAIPSNVLDDVFNSNFWPKNIFVSMFNNKRKSKPNVDLNSQSSVENLGT